MRRGLQFEGECEEEAIKGHGNIQRLELFPETKEKRLKGCEWRRIMNWF